MWPQGAYYIISPLVVKQTDMVAKWKIISIMIFICSIPLNQANQVAQDFRVGLEYPMENIKYIITKNSKDKTSIVQGNFLEIINLFMLGVMSIGLKKLFRNHYI